MKILVIGAGGMLGHKCVQILRGFGDVTGTMRKAPARLPEAIYGGAEIVHGLDVDDHEAVKRLIHEKRPDVVINAVGIIKQRDAAKEALASIHINALLPHYLSGLCQEIGAYFITVGTDCVFHCEGQGPYRESDTPNPTDLYGRSKLLGEVSAPHCLTLRTSIVGRELFAPKYGLVEWIFANQGKTVQGFRRALYSGLTTRELANIIAMLIQRGTRPSGVWHVAGPYVSKYELLLYTNEIFNLGLTIEPQDDFLCDRRLDGSRFARETGYEVPNWDIMLGAMREENALYTA